jgi:DNA-binding NarL/FixJ family response regulator
MLKVLIADDSPLICDRLKEMLADTGSIDVVGNAGDAQAAILAIQKLNPDVVILDIRMPGGGGMPVLKDIKARTSGAVVIVLTSYPYPEYRQAYLGAGANHFFDKTKDIQQMTDVLVALAKRKNGAPHE